MRFLNKINYIIKKQCFHNNYIIIYYLIFNSIIFILISHENMKNDRKIYRISNIVLNSKFPVFPFIGFTRCGFCLSYKQMLERNLSVQHL